MEWTQKYAPRSPKEYLGIKTNLRMMCDFLDRWLEKQPLKNGLVLYGPPGNGKTSILGCLEDDYNLNVIEINASDRRNSNDIKKLMNITGVKVFGRKQTVLLLDEVDGINAWQSLTTLLQNTRCPIVMTCNDIDRVSYETLDECITLEITYPPEEHVAQRLLSILRAEDDAGRIIDFDVLSINKLRYIASKCESVRSAFITLEMSVLSGTYDRIVIHKSDHSEREQIRLLFSGEALNCDLTPDTIKKWAIKNNIKIHSLDKLIMMSRKHPNLGEFVKQYSRTIRGDTTKLFSPYATNFKRSKRVKKEPKIKFKAKEEKLKPVIKKKIIENKTFDSGELW